MLCQTCKFQHGDMVGVSGGGWIKVLNGLGEVVECFKYGSTLIEIRIQILNGDQRCHGDLYYVPPGYVHKL